jgi:hypothetical protein
MSRGLRAHVAKLLAAENTAKYSFNDPHPRCVPKPPFWKACNLIIDCNQPECPRHAALRAEKAVRDAVKKASRRAEAARKREAIAAEKRRA